MNVGQMISDIQDKTACYDFSYKEFEEEEIDPNCYNVDNLLEVIETLNNKIENLTNDYNDLVDDCYSKLEEIDNIIGYYELRTDFGLD